MIFRPSASFEAEPATSRFPLTRIVVEAMGANRSGEAASLTPAETPIDLAHAQRILIDLERAIEKGEMCLRPLARAVQAEIAVAHAESNAPAAAAGDPLFRAKLQRWAIGSSDLAGLVPLREPNLRLLRFEYDVSQFRGVRTVADFPSAADSRPSFLVVFARCDEGSREPLAVDSVTAGILELSDGTRTVSEILTQLGDESGFSTLADGIQWIEGLFVRGLVRFQNSKEKWQRRGTNFRLSAI